MKRTTEQDYRRRIAKVVEHILLDPADEHTVESLAAVAHLSPYHFHRIYREITGESVAATVQRIRLAGASQQLLETGETVAEAAIGNGYNSPQAFARAFRALAGMSPSAFQAAQQGIASLPVIEQPTMRVLCLRHAGPLAAIPHSYARLRNWLVPQLPADGSFVEMGYTCEHGRQYYASIVPSVPIAAGGEFESHELEGGRYVVYRHQGAYALIATALRNLITQWLPHSGHTLDARPVMEIYRNDCLLTPAPALLTDLLIPIR